MIRLFAAALILLGLDPGVRAQGIEDCGGSTVEMSKCVWDAYQAADAELNEVWGEVLATIEPSEWMPAAAAQEWRRSLIAAQRAWVTFKSEDCEGAVAHEWYGGTGANAAVAACLYGHSRARVDDLRRRYLDK